MVGPVYFPLKRGQSIQGLLASIGDNHRVYIVTVPAPPEYAERVGRMAENYRQRSECNMTNRRAHQL